MYGIQGNYVKANGFTRTLDSLPVTKRQVKCRPNKILYPENHYVELIVIFSDFRRFLIKNPVCKLRMNDSYTFYRMYYFTEWVLLH